MKVCLVNTPFDLFKQGYGTKFKIKQGHLPPIGIGILASVLESCGHEVCILDASALSYDLDKTFEEIKTISADIIGISSLTAGASNAIELIKKIKEFSDVPVVLGGAHASCFPEKILKDCPLLDAVVIGEGERVIVELFDALVRSESIDDIKGIAYFKEGVLTITDSAPPIENLDTIPRPAWHLYEKNIYFPLPNQYKRLPATSMISSRGCPYGKCKFCFQAGLMKQKYRRNSPEYVVDHILFLSENYGIREISFWDDNFMLNAKWLKKFCDLLKEKVPDMIWTCYGRVDTISPEKLAMVSEAGCWSMFIGFESGDQHLLDLIEKGITLEQSRDAAKWASNAGVELRGSFMLGLPEETPALAKKTIAFAISLELYSAQFLPAFPEFGTKLYEIALSKGQIIEKYEGRTKAAYLPDGYESPDELERIVRKAYRDFYFRPAYILKLIKDIRGLEDIKRYFMGLKFILGLVN